jgi:hypothetical protein
MMRLILALIGLLAVLFAIANLVGGAMWDIAEGLDKGWYDVD